MSFSRDIRKYWQFIFDRKSYTPLFEGISPADLENKKISNLAFLSSEQSRGINRPPAIFLHGITKRSGTRYVYRLLGLHPDLATNPNQIWETPFLALSDNLITLQERFLFEYRFNKDKFGQIDFLPLFGAATVAHLHASIPENKRLLLKHPGVQHLDLFFTMFPHENLLLLLRDGRDVVSSIKKAWPGLNFAAICLNWARSASMAFWAAQHFKGKPGFWIGKYEDAVKDSCDFVKQVCMHFNLEDSHFPFEKIEHIPVMRQSRYLGKEAANETHFAPIGRWRSWPPFQKWIFKIIAGKPLVNLGYVEDQKW